MRSHALGLVISDIMLVAFVLWRGMPKEEAARTFEVGIYSVKRYVKTAESGGYLVPEDTGQGKEPRRERDEVARRGLARSSGYHLRKEGRVARTPARREGEQVHHLSGDPPPWPHQKKDCENWDRGSHDALPYQADPKKRTFVPFQRFVDRFGERHGIAGWRQTWPHRGSPE